jgi:hypothetical protein
MSPATMAERATVLPPGSLPLIGEPLPDDLVTLAGWAAEQGTTREAIAHWPQRPGFPAPVGRLSRYGKTRVWRRPELEEFRARWAQATRPPAGLVTLRAWSDEIGRSHRAVANWRSQAGFPQPSGRIASGKGSWPYVYQRADLQAYLAGRPRTFRDPLPDGLVTLTAWAASVGKSASAARRWREVPGFPEPAGRASQRGGGNPYVYRQADLAAFLAAAPAWPAFPEPLPDGLITLAAWAASIGASDSAVYRWRANPAFPDPAGRAAKQGGRPYVYRQAELETFRAARPALFRDPLPEGLITLRRWAAETGSDYKAVRRWQTAAGFPSPVGRLNKRSGGPCVYRQAELEAFRARRPVVGAGDPRPEGLITLRNWAAEIGRSYGAVRKWRAAGGFPEPARRVATIRGGRTHAWQPGELEAFYRRNRPLLEPARLSQEVRVSLAGFSLLADVEASAVQACNGANGFPAADGDGRYRLGDLRAYWQERVGQPPVAGPVAPALGSSSPSGSDRPDTPAAIRLRARLAGPAWDLRWLQGPEDEAAGIWRAEWEGGRSAWRLERVAGTDGAAAWHLTGGAAGEEVTIRLSVGTGLMQAKAAAREWITDPRRDYTDVRVVRHNQRAAAN